MHGTHSFPGTEKLWWAGTTARALEAAVPDAVTASHRAHNIFQSSDPDQRFRAGGLISRDGIVTDRDALHRLIWLLAQRMDEAARAPAAKVENRGIPSGYTYFMQFIAHDMVDSVVSVRREAGALRPAARNARASPLMLDTLYGAGPDEVPGAYAATEANIAARGRIPRLLLRVGEPQVPGTDATTLYCPYRDLARSTSPAADKLGDKSGKFLTEAFIADPRNDSHSFISQFTVLFVLLHNQVLGLLDAVPPGASALEDAYHRLLCARLIVTLIYRNIIEKDLLPRIVDAGVLARYRSDGKVFFDGDKDVPIEFTHGAYRFGHAMVRDSYRVRNERALDAVLALDFNPLATPQKLPVPERWFVEWARFFDTAKPADPNYRRNYSICIGPHYGAALRDPIAFPAKTPIDREGLANRDLLSASYAGLLSVPALSAKMRSVFGEQVVGSYEQWREPLRRWLTDCGNSGVPYGPGDVDRLVSDPPLPFFVLFEAEQAAHGQRLGPIGSIIVAETIFGALRSNATGFEAAGPGLRDRIAFCAETLFADREDAAKAAVASIAEIETMPGLLEHLGRAGLLPYLLPA
jgi:hypothetical protein